MYRPFKYRLNLIFCLKLQLKEKVYALLSEKYINIYIKVVVLSVFLWKPEAINLSYLEYRIVCTNVHCTYCFLSFRKHIHYEYKKYLTSLIYLCMLNSNV